MKLLSFDDLKGETPYDKFRDWATSWPVYVSPKFNGVFAKFTPGLGLETRQGKRWLNYRLNYAVNDVLIQASSANLTILGELVGPREMSFQQLCGAVAVKGHEPFPDSISLVVFDAWDLRRPAAEQSWKYRLPLIEQFKYHASAERAMTPYAADELYAFLVADGYEGCVYRCNPALPIFDGRPHPQMVKRKRRHDMEGEIIGMTFGKGKREGMLGAFIVRLPSGREVKVGSGPGLTDAILTRLCAESLIGEKLTFSYEELSDTGIPLKPQFVSLRNYE